MHRLTPYLLLLFALLGGRAAAEPEPEIIVIEGAVPARQEAADRALVEPELVTRIRLDRDAGSASLADVIGRSAGAGVRQAGGPGSFASLSVRGLDAGHTPLLIDGVPLSRLTAVAADLSRFDLRGFSELELYRGAVPGSLPAAGIGGALNLVSAVGPRPDGSRGLLSVGAGSYGARHLSLATFGGAGGFGYQLGANYAGASGDYPFFSDNGTPLNLSDDAIVKRTNNGFDRFDAVLRAREVKGDRVASGGARVFSKQQGLPGIGSRQTDRAALGSVAAVLDVALAKAGEGGDVRGAGFAVFDRTTVTDSGDEVGIGSGSSSSESVSLGGGMAGGFEFDSPVQRVAISLDARGDFFAAKGQAPQTGNRLALESAIYGRLGRGDRFALVPQARVALSRTHAAAAMERTDLDPSLRLAAVFRASASATLKASAGYAVRQPTLIEMFGDRGFLAGNPEIRAERGGSVDLGLVYAPPSSRRFADSFFELAAFASRPRDAIVYAPSSAGVARPFNVAGAEIAGAELTATSHALGLFRLSASYTFLSAVGRSDSAMLDGKALPNRARHRLYGRVGVEHSRFTLWSDVLGASGNYADQANIIELPARLFLGAGARLEVTRALTVTLEGTNLTDNIVETIALDPAPRADLATIPRPVSDYFGYPLPGRAFYLSLAAKL